MTLDRRTTIGRQMISLKKAREKLDMGDTCIRKIIATDPTFPAYFICGRWKIDEQELDKWIECKRANAGVQFIPSGRTQTKAHKKTPARQQHCTKVYEVITPGWSPGNKNSAV
ncbi:hypothetical protein BR63_05800 [Thermanaerosceptrum fracticalcis]|uniref:Uncharacterized protein n=1 Tax=Thermanaerosceptrum fracticalcis TaxID=1712410 RepID=A0A7G6E1B8_THEFR|nr:helix-turn-helix domain-containing protein [Thermanaerosceptrum fracticalcis]QNB45872.1 hypothetical protein BR63_05800 [Thermanaerosceptrum fracticalcis]